MQKIKIAVIGTGSWGSALASALSKNGHQISMYGIDQDEINDINACKNTKYFGNKLFNECQNVKASKDLKEVLINANYILFAVPSSSLRLVLKKIQKELGTKKINIINSIKGIEVETGMFYSDFINKKFGKNLKNFSSLIGPSFAVEVFENNLTMVNVVGKKTEYLKEISKLFNSDRFRVIIGDNENGSELFAALKNVLAIGVGMINFYHPEMNTQSAVLSIGTKEISEVYKGINPFDECGSVALELAGIGDIFLTCSSPKSRNYSFGYSISKFGLKQTLVNYTKTVEGFHTARILEKIIKTHSINVPFLSSIIDVLFHKKNPFKLLDFIENDY